MTYSTKEKRLDIFQFLFAAISSGIIFVTQLVIYPLLGEITDYSRLFSLYFVTLMVFFLADMITTFMNLFESIDYVKHKFLRRNIGLLFSALFVYLIFMLNSILTLIETGDKTHVPTIVYSHLIITAIYIIKLRIQFNIFELFQDSYEVLKPLE
ncbi:MAG: hypothetical protein INQ03_15320 [Candidatus Heimdallarchaeota archaeon]|nr:hypothetical protein [Candidatus Heimdallarchaeota archaeon]